MRNPRLNDTGSTFPTGAEPRSSIVAEDSEGAYIFPLGDLLRVIRKRIWTILLTTTVCVGVGLALTLLQTPMYEASIKILVGQERENSAPGSLGGDIQGLQQLTQTMTETVNSRPVANATIQQLNLPVTSHEFLENYLSVEQIKATQVIRVSYRDPDPQRAQQVADTIGDVFSEQISQVNPSASDTTARVWERAEAPDEPVSPNLILNIGLALMAGLMLGVGLAFLQEHFDDSWRSPEELEQISGFSNFGVIPVFSLRPQSKARRKERSR